MTIFLFMALYTYINHPNLQFRNHLNFFPISNHPISPVCNVSSIKTLLSLPPGVIAHQSFIPDVNDNSSSLPGSRFWWEKMWWQWAHGNSTATPLCWVISDQNIQIIIPITQFYLLPYWKTISSSHAFLFYIQILEAEIQDFPQSGPSLLQESLWLAPCLAFC